MDGLVRLLLDNPLLLLFVVLAMGYPLGHVRVAGVSLGVAAVLFAGLAVGSLHPALQLPEIVSQLGLVLFVYTVGLSSGPDFFASFRRRGLRDTALVVGVLGFAAALTLLARLALGLTGPLAAGLYAGILTNTPALASVLEYLRADPTGWGADALALPVVGYSVAYPMGVVATLAAILLTERVWRIHYARELRSVPELAADSRPLENRSVVVTRADLGGLTLGQLVAALGWDAVFARVKRGDELTVASGSTRLQPGDVVSVIGPAEELDRVTEYLGEPCPDSLALDRHLDSRLVFVSEPAVVGRRLRDLDLIGQFGAVLTRVQRGELEFLPRGDTVLQLGDRVRVVSRRENLDAVSKFFGDSYRALSEIDVLTFSLGLGLGVLLGSVPIALPGDFTVRLGLAGGPLVVALLLGARGRTGPLVWTIPYNANLTLRQFGLALFLAAVGTRAGHAFVTTLLGGGGLVLFLVGAAITLATALLTLWIGYRLLGIPMSLLVGMLAGIQTQPAVLGFALERTGNDLPNSGYAAVYPMATIAKIVIAQLLLMGTAF